jgi:hypothetical protein
MRFFVAEGAPQNDGGLVATGGIVEVPPEAGLDGLGGMGGCSKAVAEPPHSKSSWRVVGC